MDLDLASDRCDLSNLRTASTSDDAALAEGGCRCNTHPCRWWSRCAPSASHGLGGGSRLLNGDRHGHRAVGLGTRTVAGPVFSTDAAALATACAG